MREERKNDFIGDNIVLLDGGDLFSRFQNHPMFTAELFVDIFNLMGYDAVNLGEREFSNGLPLLQHMKNQARFPLISANVSSDGAPWRPYVIKEIDSVKIAIIGVLSYRLNPMHLEFSFERPDVALGKLMAELKENADIFVLLSHTGLEKAEKLVEKVGGIDLAIVSHTEKPIEGKKVGETLLVGSGWKGERVGVVDLTWSRKEKRILELKPEIQSLNDEIDYDSEIVELVEAYNVKIYEARGTNCSNQVTAESKVRELVNKTMKMSPEEFIRFQREKANERQNIQQ